MKKLLLLSIILIVGCNKSSTSSEPSCTELATTYTNAASAYSADPTNKELCDANMAAYLALANSGCPGFEAITETEINAVASMCDLFTGG